MVEAAASIMPNDRLRWLSVLPGGDRMPLHAREEIAREMEVQSFATGEVVFREGELGDRLFLVVQGRAEVSASRQGKDVPLAVLGPGEYFGEIALLSAKPERQATVRALTPLTTLTLSMEAFSEISGRDPEVRASWERGAVDSLVAKFLKLATPFTTLAPEKLRRLATSVQPLVLNAGEYVVRQGEPGECCYLLRRGSVEVLLREEEGSNGLVDQPVKERRIATLAVGAIFGEAALLTIAPRSASVRTLEPCDLLVMHREALLQALHQDRSAAEEIAQLLHLRDRPRRLERVRSYRRLNAEGEMITILNDPVRATYYQLSPQGWFIWERLDGRHTIRDLTLEYLSAFKMLAPGTVAELVGGLTASGFAESRIKCSDLTFDQENHSYFWRRITLFAQRILKWRIATTAFDPWLDRLYNGGIRLAFTRPAQVIWLLVSLGGLVAFFLPRSELGDTLHFPGFGSLLLFAAVSYLVLIVTHEAGHAFATKACGRKVRGVGLGWYWVTPIAYVDTSEMWLAERCSRVTVNLAGVYTNLVLAGLCSLGGWFLRGTLAGTVCYSFSLLSYLFVLFNLNPLLKYDGYYVLIDLLERPNLRSDFFAWLSQRLPRAIRESFLSRKYRAELIYGLAVIVYLGLLLLTGVILFQLVCGRSLALSPDPVTIPWALRRVLVGLSGLAVCFYFRPKRVYPA